VPAGYEPATIVPIGMRRTALLVGVATAAWVALAAPQAPAFTHAQKTAFRQTILKEKNRDRYPGMIAGIWKHGHGHFIFTPGHARTGARRRPMTPHTPTRIGSVTKTFTATVILRLIQEHKIHLNDTVSQYIVSGIPHDRHITIRELLNMTSGLPDFPPAVSNSIFAHLQRERGPLRLARRSIKIGPVVKPPAPFLYSNVNYLLLGVIARRVSGLSMHASYTKLFHRVGIGHTEFRTRPKLPRGIAHGYVKQNGKQEDTTRINFSAWFTAGAMISTVGDLAKWVRAIATGHHLLSPRLERARLDIPPSGLYGLGIFRVKVLKAGKAIPFYGHNGIVPGYDSMALYSPARKITIVLLGNTSVFFDKFFRKPKPPDPALFKAFGSLACIALHPDVSRGARCRLNQQ
jgi:D-alanyl-D-alanine carboxypeptidase